MPQANTMNFWPFHREDDEDDGPLLARLAAPADAAGAPPVYRALAEDVVGNAKARSGKMELDPLTLLTIVSDLVSITFTVLEYCWQVHHDKTPARAARLLARAQAQPGGLAAKRLRRLYSGRIRDVSDDDLQAALVEIGNRAATDPARWHALFESFRRK